MNRSTCYFYHIPKTAGMSTWQLLEHYYPTQRICPGRMWEDIIGLPRETLAEYDAFRGHFLAYLQPYLGRPLDTFTVLRDPVERTISHYCHVRRAPDHPSHTIAQSLTLEEFCVDQRTKHMVQNYQARCLACLPYKDPVALAVGMTKEDFSAYRLQLALDPIANEAPPSAELYRGARERMEGFVAVGISERLQVSLGIIASVLGFGVPPSFPRRNVAPIRPPNVDPKVLRLIRTQTEVDQALYQEMERELLKKLRQSGHNGGEPDCPEGETEKGEIKLPCCRRPKVRIPFQPR